MLNVKEVSEKLKVSPATIRRWVKDNKIPFIKIGRVLRFDIEKVIANSEEKK